MDWKKILVPELQTDDCFATGVTRQTLLKPKENVQFQRWFFENFLRSLHRRVPPTKILATRLIINGSKNKLRLYTAPQSKITRRRSLKQTKSVLIKYSLLKWWQHREYMDRLSWQTLHKQTPTSCGRIERTRIDCLSDWNRIYSNCESNCTGTGGSKHHKLRRLTLTAKSSCNMSPIRNKNGSEWFSVGLRTLFRYSWSTRILWKTQRQRCLESCIACHSMGPTACSRRGPGVKTLLHYRRKFPRGRNSQTTDAM